MDGNDIPTIEFPCDNYPIKVIGANHLNMVTAVVSIFMEHVPNFAGIEAFTIRPSNKGNYQSMNTRIMAQSAEQLKMLNDDLQRCEGVRLIL